MRRRLSARLRIRRVAQYPLYRYQRLYEDDVAVQVVTLKPNSYMERNERNTIYSTICTVSSLWVAISASSATEYGNLAFYGNTKDHITGAINLFIFNIAWYCQLIAVIDSLTIMVFTVRSRTTVQGPDTPFWTFVCGVYLYCLHCFFFDYAYWFNLFESDDFFDLREDNLLLYMTDEGTMVVFIIVITLLILYRYLTLMFVLPPEAKHEVLARTRF